jgi:hypothetical protein
MRTPSARHQEGDDDEEMAESAAKGRPEAHLVLSWCRAKVARMRSPNMIFNLEPYKGQPTDSFVR